MTYREAIVSGEKSLCEAGIADARNDAWLLLTMACKIDHTYYYMHIDEEMPEELQHEFEVLIKKRAERVPLQYITGEQEFMGMTFHVNSNVLDMCTGSGCVLISILKNVHGTGGYGYDISKQAINVAKENAKLNDVPAIFERSNLFEDVADETFDVIVSNPPYIRSDEIPFLMPEVSEFEPHEALDGKEDGLFFYRKIIQESPDYLTDGGYLLFEIGYDQGWAVSSMMKEAGFEDVCVKKDLARNDRVVCGHKHLCEKRG